MSQTITEEMGVHNEWYAEARKMTVDRLPGFITKLTETYEHDYGTICHAVAAAAIAAAWAVNDTPQGGITGFQGGAVMWGFITHWSSEYAGKPLRLVNYEKMLYPQYSDQFATIISKATHEYLIEQANQRLADVPDAHEAVAAHWRRIAAGEVPFGYSVGDDT